MKMYAYSPYLNFKPPKASNYSHNYRKIVQFLIELFYNITGI